jgi:cobalt/nickel transport system permease protein
MHMADALISAEVGGLLWLVSGGALARSSRAVRQQAEGTSVALTGVLGAFVFALQMINFSIPGTGSSGHLGGGLLLAVLLGPHAAFLTIASVLVVQALFFADGGLLALGCNIFNMGFLPVFVAFPLLYLPLAGTASQGRRTAATVLAAVGALLLGALGVALETRLSGLSALPLRTFLLALLPIHGVIGLAEGFATAGILAFLRQARPEIFLHAPQRPTSWRAVALIGVLAVVTGGCLSWGASHYPDGLEWAVTRVAGSRSLAPEGPVHRRLDAAQHTTALLPGYGAPDRPLDQEPTRAATSLSGVLGGALTLLLVVTAALALKRFRRAA